MVDASKESFRAPETPSKVGQAMKRSNAAPHRLPRPRLAIPVLFKEHSYRAGDDKRESQPDYCRVLDVEVGKEHRLVVCRDEIQVIHQRLKKLKRGDEWSSLSFHVTMNTILKEILQ